jgi:NAD(P)-dependent dehydrogenase (short-subunit alcohol dehydrogenase family)
MQLTDKTILITGAGGGLGSTAALALAEQGATIVLLDKNIPKLESIYDQILKVNAPEPAIYPFDLAGADENQYAELSDTIAQKYGALDGLLHSAADLGTIGPVATQQTLEWGKTLNLNLNAPFLLTRVLLPVLQQSAHAAIIFTSDSSFRDAKAYAGAFGVAKIALEGFAKILADELESRQQIRVNTLIPGPINSPLRKKSYPAENKARLPEMNSLKDIYVYLFAEDSIGVTGQVIEAQTFKRK